MIEIACRSVLLDIEGTVSPVAFVYDVMFPYARQHLAGFLTAHWDTPPVRQTIELLAIDHGASDSDAWFRQHNVSDAERQLEFVVQSVLRLMDQDAKVTGLKQLQGLVWRSGFESGQLVASLFPDVTPRLRGWYQAGLQLFVYSSGSIAAQQLFFGHTREGDLRGLFSGYFDTTTGNKKQSDSYLAIASQIGQPPASICFISDVTDELDAARQAGMPTIWRADESGPVRDGDPALKDSHPIIASFDQIRLRSSPRPPDSRTTLDGPSGNIQGLPKQV